MEHENLDTLLIDIKTGNALAREKCIRHYQPFILNTVGHICKRFISWSDEEASIGLLAFNKALDSYSASGGRTFLNYAHLLIRRDLIDYARKETRHLHLSLEHEQEGQGAVPLEADKSLQLFQQDVHTSNLVEEILELDAALQPYQVSFEELEHYSPKHRDTRETLLQIASEFLQHPDCVDEFHKKKRIPISVFVKKTGCSKKVIERHRKYLITLIILKLHPQWVYLSQYIEGLNGNEGRE